jgi:UDP-N-acetylmuramyl pentapeptide phosphotransferase/UDP-N-acetylglucosamine-1-phosphate transferase
MSAFVAVAASGLVLEGAATGAWVVLVATVGVATVGLVDDLRPLPAGVRLGAQVAAAVAVVAAGSGALDQAWTLVRFPGWALGSLSALWIVWMTNLYNFMDGIDGLAGGQTAIAGVALAAAAAGIGADTVVLLALVLAAAAGGFLLLNFPPASIFMGDVGSTAIGFFLASLPFVPGPAVLPVEAVGLCTALFVLDATATLVRRISRGERLFQAHRTHWYQRPLAVGIEHRTITLAAYPGMIAMGAAGIAYPGAPPPARVVLVVGAVALFGVYASAVRQLERRGGVVNVERNP